MTGIPKLSFLLILLSQIICGTAKATHIIGGEIYYDCLGNGRFKITLKVYRDCLNGQAPFDDPLNVSVFDAQGRFIRNIVMPLPGSRLVPLQNLNPCYRDNAKVCVEEAVYSQEVTLPYIEGGYQLAYQRCCRNESILNIFQPGDTGSTYTTSIPGSAWSECNSSPRYNQLPPIILCANDPINFNNSATDPDGDSLVYAFCEPHDGASTVDPMPVPSAAPPYGYVNFKPPFSALLPIASNPPISIDAKSGLITGKPGGLGQYVMAVCVYEYRKGALLSRNLRDFQFNVLMCTGASVADFDAPEAIIENGLAPCKGLEVNFLNQSSNAATYLWDFGVPGTESDRSNLVNPIFIYPDTGRYTVTLITNPGYSCGDTATLEVALFRALQFKIKAPDALCLSKHEALFTLEGSIPNDADYTWSFDGPATPSGSTLPAPGKVVWADTGRFSVKLRIRTPVCEGADSSRVIVYPPLKVNFEIDKLSSCVPAIVRINDSSLVSPGAIYLWDFGDGTTSSEPSPGHVYNLPGIYTLKLRVNNTLGCRDSFYQAYPDYIHVKPRPIAALSADPAQNSILSPEIRFNDLSTESIDTWLYPGDGIMLEEADTLYTYSDTGSYKAFLVAVNDAGCYDTASFIVRINPVFAVYVPNTFTPDGDGINDTFGPRGEGFTDFLFSIYSRWGEEIFSTRNPQQDWDGTASGGKNMAPVDIYIYQIKLKGPDKVTRTIVGKVLLLH